MSDLDDMYLREFDEYDEHGRALYGCHIGKHRTRLKQIQHVKKPTKTMDPTTRTFFIAGVQFRPDYRLVATKFDKGEYTLPHKLGLIGEPANKYDRYAVKIMAGVIQLGYVPKPYNIDLWALRDSGLTPIAVLVEYNPNAPTHQMFKVEVHFHKPKIAIAPPDISTPTPI